MSNGTMKLWGAAALSSSVIGQRVEMPGVAPAPLFGSVHQRLRRVLSLFPLLYLEPTSLPFLE